MPWLGVGSALQGPRSPVEPAAPPQGNSGADQGGEYTLWGQLQAGRRISQIFLLAIMLLWGNLFRFVTFKEPILKEK